MITRENFKKRTIITVLIIIALCALVSTGIVVYKHYVLNKEYAKLEEEIENKYEFHDTSKLTFLNDELLKEYRRKVIDACEAYDLVEMENIYILENTIFFDPETSLYEWTIQCDDSKATSFVSAFKRTNETFTVEREYNGINGEQMLEDIEKKEQVNEKTAEESKQAAANINIEEENVICVVDKITYPKDCSFVKTTDKQNLFKKTLRDYLTTQGLTSVGSVEFKNYVTPQSDEKADMVFILKDTAPEKYTEIECVATKDGFNFSLTY